MGFASENWTHFIHYYYATNVLLLLTYLPVRAYFPSKTLEEEGWMPNINREAEWCILLNILLMKKYKAAKSLSGYVDTIFLFLKALVAVLLWNREWRIMLWFIIVCAVCQLLVHRPDYGGPSDIEYLSPASFNKITNGPQNISWVVFFTANASWHNRCADLEVLISQLSVKYTSPTLKFAKVDALRWSGFAQEYIKDTSATSQQLPTLILMEGGYGEVQRLPPVQPNGSIVKVSFDEAGLVQLFELAKRSKRAPERTDGRSMTKTKNRKGIRK